MGRKKLPLDVLRNQRVIVRLTSQEKLKLKRKRKKGQTVSDVLRDML